jgi:hypothetical protein
MEPMSAVDIRTVDKIVDQAKTAGLDPVEQLHRAGLILTERRLMQLRTEAMEQIVDMIDNTPAHALLKAAGQPSNLAEDYRKVLIEMLGDLAGKARAKWFA